MTVDWTNRLAKWRTVFAGWQLGTRPIDDPECQAVRDHREVTLMLRAEVSALAALLVKKGIFTTDELNKAIQEECRYLSKAYEIRFPGFRAVDSGMEVDVDKSQETTKNWKP